MAYKHRAGTWRQPGPPLKTGRKTTRDLIRLHVRAQCMSLVDALKGAWCCLHNPRLVWNRMHKKQPLSPWHIARAADTLGLTNEERLELMLLGAREAGWDVYDPRVHAPESLPLPAPTAVVVTKFDSAIMRKRMLRVGETPANATVPVD